MQRPDQAIYVCKDILPATGEELQAYINYLENKLSNPDQDIMDKVKAIRDKTKLYTWVQISYDAFRSGKTQIEYQYGSEHRIEAFPTREALVAHMDGILEGL